MKRGRRWFTTIGLLFASGWFLQPGEARAQGQQAPGHPIGTVSTRGDLIILELDEGVIAPANLFDLVQRTLRFTPESSAPSSRAPR
jgi:hypothetical protein